MEDVMTAYTYCKCIMSMRPNSSPDGSDLLHNISWRVQVNESLVNPAGAYPEVYKL